MGRDSNPRRGKKFFCSPKCPDIFFSGVLSRAESGCSVKLTSHVHMGYEWVELYLYSLYMSSWHGKGNTLPLRFTCSRTPGKVIISRHPGILIICISNSAHRKEVCMKAVHRNHACILYDVQNLSTLSSFAPPPQENRKGSF